MRISINRPTLTYFIYGLIEMIQGTIRFLTISILNIDLATTFLFWKTSRNMKHEIAKRNKTKSKYNQEL